MRLDVRTNPKNHTRQGIWMSRPRDDGHILILLPEAANISYRVIFWVNGETLLKFLSEDASFRC